LRPFRYRAFAVIWAATVVADIGSWMYSAAAAWLMTTLDSDPLMVSLVQVAASLPVFLLALPAGALADSVDKRQLLIGAELFITATSTAVAVLVWQDVISPVTLLLFTFLIEAGTATAAPWQSIVPQLVPRDDLPRAVMLNSVGVNISRTLGPALGGVIIAGFGIAAPFFANAVSNVGTIGALWWWRPAHEHKSHLPTERLVSAMRVGVRHARHNASLLATLARAAGFFLFASCYWALLPLVAHHQVAGGPALYGLLLGAIGVSGIVGAVALPWLKPRFGPDVLVAAGSIGTAVALMLFGAARNPTMGVAASFIAGICWIAVLSTLNVSTQLALPEWVRGRGLAIYVMVFFGVMTLGSALWGVVARFVSVPTTFFIAAGGALLAVSLTWRWKLHGRAADLTPSMHWPTPVVSKSVESDPGPVLVTVEYWISPQEREAFLTALEPLSAERGRDGAYGWGIFEDTAEPGRFVETFFVESWVEHLRQHERVTNADRVLEQQVHRFSRGTPKVTHLAAARRAPTPNSHRGWRRRVSVETRA
jgi:MFS family permease